MDERRGIPDEYVEASRRIVGEDQKAQWEKGVRASYKQTMVIAITPTWVKINDFVRTFPGPSRAA